MFQWEYSNSFKTKLIEKIKDYTIFTIKLYSKNSVTFTSYQYYIKNIIKKMKYIQPNKEYIIYNVYSMNQANINP